MTRCSRIAGVVACLPKRQVRNDEFEASLGREAIDDVSKMIGVHTRHWVDDATTTADLCQAAAEHLLAGLAWPAETVDALIFLSQTPDYRLPATACALHGKLGMRSGAIAFDVNLGCSGYPYALWLAQMMVQSGAAKRVLLAVGDTISKTVDKTDRATALLFGDAGTATAIEADERAQSDMLASHFILGSDGAGASNLIIPQGGFKQHVEDDDARWHGKAMSCLFMDGGQVFNFTLQAVPALIESCVAASGRSLAQHDGFLFHQANQFMLKHLVKKAKLPADRVPINIDKVGNCSSASIPLLMCTELAPRLSCETLTLAMFGFGVGYSWAGASVPVGQLSCIGTIYL